MKEDLILRPDDIFQLNVVLTTILDAALLDLVMIINKSGRLITAQSEPGSFDKTSLSALVTGTFASSSSIANLVGEKEFESMYQEGKERHIYICQIDYNNIFSVVFSDRTSLNKVKVVFEQYKAELLPTLQNLYNDVAADPFLNLDVSNYNPTPMM